MGLILSIETSTSVCSVAVHQKGALLSISEINADKSHSRLIIPMILEVLKTAGIDFKNLNAVAISKGPGSYTGLRIGTSTAKGICYAHDLPLLGIGTLEALALQVISGDSSGNTLYYPMLDARRMEVYTMAMDQSCQQIFPVSAMIIDEHSFIHTGDGKRVVLFGPGSVKCKSILSHRENIEFLDHIQPSAKTIGQIAWLYYMEERFENLAGFEPFYLKEFQTTVPKKKI